MAEVDEERPWFGKVRPKYQALTGQLSTAALTPFPSFVFMSLTDVAMAEQADTLAWRWKEMGVTIGTGKGT